MTEYVPKPAQFRLPAWAHEFLARESAEQGVTKTEVVVEALRRYEEQLFDERLAKSYTECAEVLLEETREWDALGVDTLEGWEW